MDRRAAVIAVAVLAAAATPAGLASAATGDADRPRASSVPGEGPPSAPGPQMQGDRDGDHVSDDFEDRLRGADAAEQLDVIVTGFDSATAHRAVGRFTLNHELPLIDGFAATMSAGQARGLSHHPAVRRIEADGVMRILDDATNRDFGATAARTDHPGVDGSAVGICVVDTGIDPDHEQIAPRTVGFVDYVNGRTAPYDDHGHGTHVAAIAAGDGTGGSQAATYVGVAPAADLFAAKVLGADGFGNDSDVVAGIQWCHEQGGVDVISLSIGGGGGDGTDAGSLAVDNAVAGGDVVVVAAGNSGDLPGTVNAPGVAKGAITVGAVSDHSAPPGTARSDDGIWLAAFSSRGPTTDGRIKPDVVAPGVSVTAADAGTSNGYATYSGTSMATPFVSGAVALGLDANPGATPEQVRTALLGSALDVGGMGKDNEWGAGLVDVREFVDRLSGALLFRDTAFPTWSHAEGVVRDNGWVDIPVPVSDDGVGVPIAATVTIEGQQACYWGCLIVEWTPDLDVQLLDPSGRVVATSECALAGVSCGIGRQETIGFRPTTTGTYTLRVYAFTGEPNYGKGGSFSVDLFHGPLSGGTEEPGTEPAENQPPVANAGPDLTVELPRKSSTATFTLDGTGSFDPDGTVQTYAWSGDGTGVGSVVEFTEAAGTYVYTLTVTDNAGATDFDSVSVSVVERTNGNGGGGGGNGGGGGKPDHGGGPKNR